MHLVVRRRNGCRVAPALDVLGGVLRLGDVLCIDGSQTLRLSRPHGSVALNVGSCITTRY
jgi:hypothetical protein